MKIEDTQNGNAGQPFAPPAGSAFDRLEDLLIEDQARRQCVSLNKAQQLLLKIAKQQQEIQRLNSLLAAERQRSNELSDRWAQVRSAVKAQADDSVLEVMRRIMPNDPSSATRRTGRNDCNRDAPAGFAAAHG